MSTQQTYRAYHTDTTGYADCVHFARTQMFDLCLHPTSEYQEGEFHTTQHMREHHVGLCGKEQKLFTKKEGSALLLK